MGSTTLRLPDPLKAEAEAYAASLGLSLNALCAVALRDYLDARRVGVVPEPVPAVVLEPKPKPVHAPKRERMAALPAGPVRYAAPKDVYAPCPCGSGKKWKWCHGQPGA